MRLIDGDPISNVLQEKIINFMRKSLDEIDENPDNPYAGSTASFTAGLLKCVKDTLIDTAPTIEAEPVRHGYWDASGKYIFPDGSIAVQCSECGCDLEEHEYKEYWWHYCPVCVGRRWTGRRRWNENQR